MKPLPSPFHRAHGGFLAATRSWQSLRSLILLLSGTLLISRAQADELYISDYENGTISRVSDSGVVSLFVRGLDHPRDLAFSGDDLFVVTGTRGIIYKISRAGTVSTMTVPSGILQGIAVNPRGEIFVSNTNAAGEILKIDRAGNLSTFVSGLTNPGELAADAQGNLFVKETIMGNMSVTGGTLIAKVSNTGVISTFVSPLADYGVQAVDAHGDLYVARSGALVASDQNTIARIKPDGTTSTFARNIPSPIHLAFDSQGNLYVTGILANNAGTDCRIYKVTSTGAVSLVVSGLNYSPFGLATYPTAAKTSPSAPPSPGLSTGLVLVLCVPTVILMIIVLTWFAVGRKREKPTHTE